uniref:uncharacterized protein LOC105352460 isoform X2 n=1 Tax=Fragaria vesca subsp. vesca TaxID=101020 RepID=UPI0005CA56C8|nr:PREDICTED: uncharacterized protein LOC105352460 isoform X2 [Fragaria vesca subsp. vesca]
MQVLRTIMKRSIASNENLDVSESVGEETAPTSKDEGTSSTGASLTTDLSFECRICQTEDSIDHMEAPCRCNGTLKFTHRACIQQWINSRFKTTCEICNQPYKGDYRVTVPPPASPPQPTNRQIEEIRRVLEEAERLHAAAARAEVYLARLNAANNAVLSRSALCRIAVLVLLVFLCIVIGFRFIHSDHSE